MTIQTWTVDELRQATLRQRWTTNASSATVTPYVAVGNDELTFAEFKAALIVATEREAHS